MALTKRLQRRTYRMCVAASMTMLLIGSIVAALIVTGVYSSHPAHAASSTAFVTLDSTGRGLMQGGQAYRFSGANIYWLASGADGSSDPYKTQVTNILQVVKSMKQNVVRANTMGMSIDCSTCVEPSLGTINQNSQAFANIDYALSVAQQDGIKLVIPFVDEWTYGPDNPTTWASWRGDSNRADFYTNATIISDFETYISAFLNHKNAITGVLYKNDPTILAWEEGNELYDAPTSWINTIATYLKAQDTNHLVAFSSRFGLQQNNSLSVKNVDIEDAHYYPTDATSIVNDAKTAYQDGKVFYVGEFAWNDPFSALPASLSAIAANSSSQGYLISGDTYWDLWPRGIDHQDSSTQDFTLHYPGDTTDMSTADTDFINHAQTMTAGNATGTGGATPTPTTTGGSGIPIGQTIWLKASTGEYVSAWTADTNAPLEARSTAVQAWEEFTVIDEGSGKIALLAQANSEYVSAWTADTNAPLEARATTAQAWETFQWINEGSGSVALLAQANSEYVSAWSADTNTPLEARATTAQAWETFQWGTV